MSDPILIISEVSKSFGGVKVLEKVAFNIRKGARHALIGPNGAGKTTTFYMLVGLIKSDGGEIKIDDQIVTSLPMHTRSNLGISYLPQEASIFKNLTVEELRFRNGWQFRINGSYQKQRG